jgi:signal transduction histidine kinase
MPRMPQMFGKLLIRSRLSLGLAVPVAAVVLLTVLLGVAGAAGAWSGRAGAREEGRSARVAGQAVAAVHELQEERVRAVAWAAGRGRAGEAELSARRRRADRALAAYRAGAAGLGPSGDPALDRALATAAGWVASQDRLAVQRALVDRRLVPPDRAGIDHDTMIAALLGVARGLADRLAAPEPARVGRLLLAVTEAKEATGQERTLLAAAPPGPATVPLAAAAAVARQELGHLRAAAGDRRERIDRTLGLPRVRTVRGLELALLQPVVGPPAARDLAAWRDGLADRSAALRRVEEELAGDLDAAARTWLGRQERRLRDRLALVAAIVLATLVAALARRWGAARRTARPGAAWATVPGLARRAQALADRQLQLLEGLTRDEPDPHRRQGLAGVDHLATRLRRAAETLLAMTGSDPAGRRARPTPVATLLRAAVAEADAEAGHGQDDMAVGTRRVELVANDEVEVDGRAGTDLVHLLAELLDNAAAFSPPTAPVVVTGAADGDGYRIGITDRGLGMTGQELAWANQRLAGGAAPEAADQAAGDRLGLPIVARLAHGHGFAVRLGPSPEGGVTATVRIPATVLSTRAPAPVPPS